jgi:hypothetical protein
LCNWFCKAVCNGEVDSLLIYFTVEACVYLHGHLNSQDTNAAENPRLIHDVVLYYIKFGVWCAVSATRTIRAIFIFRRNKF